jgi:HAD superfamily hydrolase (TIGR01490 family)
LSKYREASLFDLDRTLIKENSSYRFGSYLKKNQYISLFPVLYFVSCYTFHKIGFLSLQAFHAQIFKLLFKGRPFDPLQKMAVSFLEEHFQHIVYQPALNKLNQAKESGHYTVILSSSPDFLVELFAKRFGVDEWLATNYAVDSEQRFCRVKNVLDGSGKAQFLLNLSRRLNIAQEKTTVYSDSILDLPFLKAAGQALGVNPDSQLRALCEKYEWDII